MSRYSEYRSRDKSKEKKKSANKNVYGYMNDRSVY